MQKKQDRYERTKQFLQQYPDMGLVELIRMVMAQNLPCYETLKGFTSYKSHFCIVKRDMTQKHTAVHPRSFPSTSSFAEIKRAVMPESYNPYNFPEAEDDAAKRFKLPKADNDILFMSDIHIPFHDIHALTAAIRFGKDNKVNTVYMNGDIIDFYAISRFQKQKSLRNLANELHKTREFLGILRDIFPAASIYYKVGNHDARWNNYIISNAGDFEGLEEFTLESILHLPKYGIKLIESSTIVEIGKLLAIHGHEVYGFGGVNPARNLFLKSGCSVIEGHVHRTSEHAEPNMKGELISCWSVGCLSELRPNYNPNSKYNHGFARIRTDDNDNFHVDNKKIYNGKIL